MKIEIGESLTYSYLKHIEGCRVVQTNWKTSEQWEITEDEKEQAKDLFQKVKSAEGFDGIFKKSTFDQLMKQAEIDVLGLNTTDNTVYGIDIAFHAAGLNYSGGKEKNAENVIKKIFRTIFVMQTYFSKYTKFESIFITPKVNPATESLLDNKIRQAKEIISGIDNITIDFIANDRFYNEIVKPVVELEKEHDTSELFARAIKLLQIGEKSNTITNSDHIPNKKPANNKRTTNGMKIGKFVQYVFRDAFKKNLITNKMIENLQNVDYSNKTFNAKFEILRKSSISIIDTSGMKRYYANKFFCSNYWLTSQWYEPQWDLLLKWLISIGYEVNESEVGDTKYS